MPENPNAFKHGLSPKSIQHIASLIAQVEPSFDRDEFVRIGCLGLGALELKARVLHVIEALRSQLPQDPAKAVAVLVATGEIWVREPRATDGPSFAAWPIIDFVGVHGRSDIEGSMEALRRLTHLFSAEFAVRPFLIENPKKALQIMSGWRSDPDEHVRRLVSEGTRPRLPWGQRLRDFVRDPQPVFTLIEGLQDDPAEYVRRSVANNLNDIAKDHPEAVLEVCEGWAQTPSSYRDWVIKRGTRSLVKDGHPRALELLGFDPQAKLQVSGLAVTPSVRVGDSLSFSFEVRSQSAKAQALVVDYAVHHVKKDGKLSPKVFKLRTLELQAKQVVDIEKKHSFKKVTTRVYYPGRHAIEILINGQPRGSVEFDVEV